MKVLCINYNVFGCEMPMTIPVVEMIDQLPDALKVETIIDIMEILTGQEHLEDFQKAIFKEHMKKLNRIINYNLTNL